MLVLTLNSTSSCSPLGLQGALSYNAFPTLSVNDFGPSNWNTDPSGAQTLKITGPQLQKVVRYLAIGCGMFVTLPCYGRPSSC